MILFMEVAGYGFPEWFAFYGNLFIFYICPFIVSFLLGFFIAKEVYGSKRYRGTPDNKS